MPRLKVYADKCPGVPLQTVWTDIRPLHNLSAARTYRRHKPRNTNAKPKKITSLTVRHTPDPSTRCPGMAPNTVAGNRSALGVQMV